MRCLLYPAPSTHPAYEIRVEFPFFACRESIVPLDPVPSEGRLSESAGRAAKKMKSIKQATWEEYEDMVADRPAKFDQTEVNYRDAKKGGYQCSGCKHFYVGVVAGRNVCEILRTVPEESIEPTWVCDFFNVNGKTYPLLDGRGE